MAFVFSVSGSTIVSETERLHELFKWNSQAIEIGDMKRRDDFDDLVSRCHRFGIALGIHSPLFVLDDRRGLLWDENNYAWEELERNLEIAAREGLDYVLVHFPYIWDKTGHNLGANKVRETIPRLKRMELASGVPIVCEPKLGPKKDPSAFMMLLSVSRVELSQWELSLCLDVGDIFFACRGLHSSYEQMITHLAPWCRVVHLHQVWFGGTKYFWTPVERDGCVPILKTLEILGKQDRDIYAVIEHTPHRVLCESQVETGVNWLLQNAGPWKGREGLPPTFDGKYKAVR